MKPIDQIEHNSVICFLGDSITASGIWENEIFHELLSRFPDKKLRLYNCGIRGDNSANCLKRVYRDCLCFHPDYVVLMLGMNDINVTLYTNDSAQNLEQRQRCIEEYRKNMAALMDVIGRSGARLILCTPTICGSVPNNKPEKGNFTPGLEACAEFIREQAANRGTMLIDFQEALWHYTGLQEPIVSDDCVHPTKYGYHIMAQLFMVQMGIRETVDLTPYTETNEKIQERFDIEGIVTNIWFCELAMQWAGVDTPSLTIEERKAWIRENATPANGPYWTRDVIERYLNTADYRDMYIGRLVELTDAILSDG